MGKLDYSAMLGLMDVDRRRHIKTDATPHSNLTDLISSEVGTEDDPQETKRRLCEQLENIFQCKVAIAELTHDSSILDEKGWTMEVTSGSGLGAGEVITNRDLNVRREFLWEQSRGPRENFYQKYEFIQEEKGLTYFNEVVSDLFRMLGARTMHEGVPYGVDIHVVKPGRESNKVTADIKMVKNPTEADNVNPKGEKGDGIFSLYAFPVSLTYRAHLHGKSDTKKIEKIRSERVVRTSETRFDFTEKSEVYRRPFAVVVLGSVPLAHDLSQIIGALSYYTSSVLSRVDYKDENPITGFLDRDHILESFGEFFGTSCAIEKAVRDVLKRSEIAKAASSAGDRDLLDKLRSFEAGLPNVTRHLSAIVVGIDDEARRYLGEFPEGIRRERAAGALINTLARSVRYGIDKLPENVRRNVKIGHLNPFRLLIYSRYLSMDKTVKFAGAVRDDFKKRELLLEHEAGPYGDVGTTWAIINTTQSDAPQSAMEVRFALEENIDRTLSYQRNWLETKAKAFKMGTELRPADVFNVIHIFNPKTQEGQGKWGVIKAGE